MSTSKIKLQNVNPVQIASLGGLLVVLGAFVAGFLSLLFLLIFKGGTMPFMFRWTHLLLGIVTPLLYGVAAFISLFILSNVANLILPKIGGIEIGVTTERNDMV